MDRINDVTIGSDPHSICVVIPAYKVKASVLEVISSIGPEVKHIVVVDDACPEQSGNYVSANNADSRVEIIFHSSNLGVGGAVKSGYRRALALKADIVVKIDGDGQMDTSKIQDICKPIITSSADYVKGNRFFDVNAIRKMPKIRIIGNLILSFMTKFSTGLWHVFDPNNGFIAISGDLLRNLELDKIDDGYFFESDLLFRAGLLNARVSDMNLPAIYGDEISSLKIRRVLIEFPIKHLRNTTKRIVYTYYLRDFNLASIELPLGLLLSLFGFGLGTYSWLHGLATTTATETGTLILISMSSLAGLQLILAFFHTTQITRISRKRFYESSKFQSH